MKLRKDGKLTQQEHQRRFEQNLCMFCGKVGHIAKDCHKAIAAKARSASTDTKSADKTSDRCKIVRFKKSVSSPPGPTPEEGCVVSLSAIMDLRLNASALSSPNSLTLNLSSDAIPNT